MLQSVGIEPTIWDHDHTQGKSMWFSIIVLQYSIIVLQYSLIARWSLF
jgi:hypothetical protein